MNDHPSASDLRAESTAFALPGGAVLRPLPLPESSDGAPDPLIRAYAAVRNATIREVTGRDGEDMTAEQLLPLLYDDAYRQRRQWYVEQDGELVGYATLNVSLDGDGRTANGAIWLLARTWGRGIGSAVLPVLEEAARREGIHELQAWIEHPASDAPPLHAPTGFGTISQDHAARFLLRHGFALEQVERVSIMEWDAGVEDRLRLLRAQAEERAADYRVVQWSLPTPPEHVDGYAAMKSRMSTDAPSAALDVPEEVWDEARIAQHDQRYLDAGRTVLVTAAQHRVTGELCAYNELSVPLDRPDGMTDQEDTLVLAAHRGHRLGMLVKTAGLLALRERHPASDRIITYNAEENRPMLDINESIGFTAVAYEGAWRKDLK
ncbi:GNAT superfamily N-acetyltransferase [Microbacterium resistens]|uniref:GNAT superfamily N-acetyltransferase n=1 Tax=Microbacterium resistens TaxID=156977 RepID=A0ABU1S9M8_9MICO|nr:GNAT family N-acetyltransferase [Microbacterium resistens]MDR6865968.1 GNAT superfamily N-acetyltransferase [Microbacterium resistens]